MSAVTSQNELEILASRSHLDRLESEAITIIREVVSGCESPVLLFSGGKDSAVLLWLAIKAFAPARLPFPVMQVDTGHNFPEVLEYRDEFVRKYGLELVVASVQESIDRGDIPDPGPTGSRNRQQAVTLLTAIRTHKFDAAFGGGRRDEDKARAKERIFSFRTATHGWDPKNQRPELWNLYNTRKAKSEGIRVFPISNWTELDIWQYIHLENIEIVPLYFSAPRPTVTRNGMLLMIDDERFPLQDGEVPVERSIRFRTLGCYPLTGAVESTASTLPEVIQEMLLTTTSERQGRAIDHDQAASMEKKKQEGYF
ncbi:MAG: hypothetical protein RLZZ604_1074 [Pseudomonadota bacterium]